MKHVKVFLRRFTLTDWLALTLLLLYIALFSTLTIRQHLSFNTNALDLAKFDQSIWNTAMGRPYAITIGENLVIESHFSPALALFAPLYWLWPDIRLLFIVQAALLGGAGFLIYYFFRRQNPWLGLAVFAAYLLNPTLHQVNLVEFRRLTLAVFAVSFAIYHLLRRRYGWMALGLALALLSKEDMSLVVMAVGMYILLIQRNRKVGLVTLGIGLLWLIVIPFVLLPSLMTNDVSEGYQHADAYFAYLGASPSEMISTVLRSPAVLGQYAGDMKRVTAVANFLWPTAFLFLLAPEIALLLLPNLSFLLLSTSDAQGRLEAWYPSVLLIILFWAVAVGVNRLTARWQRLALILLLLVSAIAWVTTSRLWPGPRFDRQRYQISAHERQVESILRAKLRDIPQDTIVMAQDPLVPHLAHRQDIYMFPWVRHGNRPDIIAFDRDMRTYPLSSDEYRTQFYDVFAGTEYALTTQADTFFLFSYVGEDQPTLPLNETWGDALHLYGYNVAVAPPEGVYSADLQDIPAGSSLRVALYWEVMAEMGPNYTVFVHAVGSDGGTLVQHDSWPADSHRPTSVLPVGERVRDVHYLTLPQAIKRDDLTLRVGVYESLSGEPLLLEGQRPFLLLNE